MTENELAKTILPSDVQSLLSQDYSELNVQFQCGSSFSVEGLRSDTGDLEFIEVTSLNNIAMGRRLRKDFEHCASDPSNALKAIDSHVSGNHYFARFLASGQSLYRKFVHSRPYIGGEEGLDMLNHDLSPILHRDKAQLLQILLAGISICEAVLKLHEENTLHNSINPHICYWLHGVVLRGRCLTNTLSDDNAERTEDDTTSYVQNILPYLSPEATGRVDQKPDFRSDIYSIGCTIFELLVGRPPFIASDMLTYLHRHLTSKPVAVSELSTSIPQPVSDVLAKCLEKSSALRYQTVVGLKYDLEALHAMLQSDNLGDFKIGSLDEQLRFEIAKSLCGRDAELGLLRRTWKQVTASTISAIIVISGPSGIGKSQLIGKLLEESDQAPFAGSRYQQYGRGLPFQALVEAMQNLVRQVLSHSRSDFRYLRQQLLQQPSLVSVLADKVPEIKSFNGDISLDHEKNLEATPQEVRSRLHSAFVFVLQKFAQKRGLILFQDDSQWAGSDDMDVINDIALQVPNLLLILARRPADVEDHISPALHKLRARAVLIIEITLGNLTVEDIQLMVEKSLHRVSSSDLRILARFVHDRTNGNPFLSMKMLEALHRNRKIYFDLEERQWRFDIRAVSTESLSLGLIDMITRQMRSLSYSVQTMLMTAAALGQESFNLNLLSQALDETLEETRAQIQIALDHNILRSTDDGTSEQSTSTPQEFSFLHERTQEAAYALASASEQAKIHHKIAHNILQTRTFRSVVRIMSSFWLIN